MSIKTRILFALVAIFTVALAAIGFATVALLRDQMIDRVDRELVQLFDNIDDSMFLRQNPSSPEYWKRSVAILFFDPTGSLVSGQPSGYIDQPDPLPRITHDALVRRTGSFFTTDAVDGSDQQYRVLVRRLTNDGYLAAAIPLDFVGDTLASLIWVIVLTSAAVLFAVVVFAWIAIQRGLLPIDDMIDTAETIAAGDLSQRVVVDDPKSEVGKLGEALNNMLTQIETSFRAREASESRLRQFVADASHELRTPLTSIRGYAELFRSGAASSPEKLQRVMLRIESEGERMSNLVNAMLQLARLDQTAAGALDTVDLVPIVRDAVMDAATVAPDRMIKPELPERAPVYGNADELKQVVDNLLANVRIHAGPEATARVRIDAGPNATTFEIIDDGIGMSAEQAAHAFDRFYRADPSRSSASGGSGLGLSIVKSIVETAGGHISLTSVPNQGTTVRVTLRSAPSKPD